MLQIQNENKLEDFLSNVCDVVLGYSKLRTKKMLFATSEIVGLLRPDGTLPSIVVEYLVIENKRLQIPSEQLNMLSTN